MLGARLKGSTVSVLVALASTWAPTGLVSAPGGPYLRDAQGRLLELHGVDLVAKCGGGAVPTGAPGSPCVGPNRGPHLAYVLSPLARDPGRRFTAADAATLARLGFNMVRLGVVWEGLEPGRRGVRPDDPRFCSPHARGTPFPRLGKADPYAPKTIRAYLARTDRIIGLLAAAGLRVLLDMHQDVYGSAFANPSSPMPWNGEGAPPWATCTGRAAFTAPARWGAAYGDPAVKTAIHHFFANDVRGDLQEQFARVWQAVARHYRHNANVIGYELYNEPLDFLNPDFNTELQCFYGGPVHEPRSCASSGAESPADGLIGAIRAVDLRHPIVYEPPSNSDYNRPQSIGVREPLPFRGLVLGFHAYSHQQAALMGLMSTQRAATRTLQPGGPPWLMDEFGASRHSASASATVDLADERNLSWSYWAALELHDPTGNPREALLRQGSRRPIGGKAAALAVAYPAATAGIPGPWSYDRATGTFIYDYRASGSLRAPTEIVLPRYAYPHGYRVSATGAAIVSSHGASVLELQPRRGVRFVTVTVRRG
ncbi:MAG: cellulase family glycosylhydrolase [Solirubrobacteraceae bacterium]